MLSFILVILKSTWPLKGGVTIDDQWDHFNRSFLFILLIMFGLVAMFYPGKAIDCTGFTIYDASFTESYCLTQGLYTIRQAYDRPSDNVPYPGILPEDVPSCQERALVGGGTIVCPAQSDIKKPERVYHLWYQWVRLYFFLLAITFYTPYLLMNQLGMGEVETVIKRLHNPLETSENLQQTINEAVTWLYYKCNTYYYKKTRMALIFEKHWLGFVVVCTKLLYLCFSIIVFHLTGRMFGIGNFSRYGYDWVTQAHEHIDTSHRTHVRHVLFPKMVACEIRQWSMSGMIEENGMCVLAPNVIYQYLFLILWFALVIVIPFNVISILVSMVHLPLTKMGYWRFLNKSFVKEDEDILRMYCNIGMSGRIILHLLATYVPPQLFEKVVKELSRQILQAERDRNCPSEVVVERRHDAGSTMGLKMRSTPLRRSINRRPTWGPSAPPENGDLVEAETPLCEEQQTQPLSFISRHQT